MYTPKKKRLSLHTLKKTHFNFNAGRKQSFSQARCAASCDRNHFFVRARREVLGTKDLSPSLLTRNLFEAPRAFQLFNEGRLQSFSQARCAASCARNHSFVRARRELLETNDLRAGFLTWGVCSKRRAHFNFNAGHKQSFSRARCAASCACNHSFVRARRGLLETNNLRASFPTWEVCLKRRAHFDFNEGFKQSFSQARCAASCARSHSFVRARRGPLDDEVDLVDRL